MTFVAQQKSFLACFDGVPLLTIFRCAILERFQIEPVRQTRFVWDAFQRSLIQMKSGDVISRRDLKRQRVDGKARKSITLALQIFS